MSITTKAMKKVFKNVPKGVRSFGFVVRTADPSVQEGRYGIKSSQMRGGDQFSQGALTDLGELPHGEIPEALKVSRPYEETKLSNGITVCTENWPSKSASVGVYIKCGSRFEALEESGVNNFLSNLNMRGTSNRSRDKLEGEIEGIGGHLHSRTDRETTSYVLNTTSEHVSKAFDLLGDMISNSSFNKNQVEAERETIMNEMENHDRSPNDVLLENAHYNSYRDHMMGQPLLGARENVGNITQDMIKKFRDTHYTGNRIVVVASGGVSHKDAVDLAEKHFGKIAKESENAVKNTDHPWFSPGCMWMHDDDLPSAYIATFFKAPGFNDEGFYPAMLFKKMIGDYDPQTYREINKHGNNYRAILTYLPKMISLHQFKTFYIPYSDTGLFGHIAASHEVEARVTARHTLQTAANYANNTAQHEVYHARNKLYHDLMQLETAHSVNDTIGRQQLAWGRRVTRTEAAKRLAHITPDMVTHLANEWFYDGDFTITGWGAILNVQGIGPYKFFKWQTCPGSIDVAKYHMKHD